jgi:Transposase IS66 family
LLEEYRNPFSRDSEHVSRTFTEFRATKTVNRDDLHWTHSKRILKLSNPKIKEAPTGNLAENSMRPVALGRRNWIHIGSAQAGPKIAAILSVVESCRRLKLPVRDYLAAVLPGLADCPIQRLPELTPVAMATQRC